MSIVRFSAYRAKGLTIGVSASVESAWRAVPALLLVRFPRPLAEPGVRLSPHRALRGFCRGLVQAAWTQGLGIWLPR
jgi:hypothetical protein